MLFDSPLSVSSLGIYSGELWKEFMMPFTHRRVANTIGTILTIIALIAIGFSWKATVDERHANAQLKKYVQCQADWSSFFLSAITENRNSTIATSQALDDLINAVTSAKSATDTRAALAKYLAARASQKENQKKNPLPPPPDQICQLKDA
jgi:hypothetical protein